jgi:hypothetical protein
VSARQGPEPWPCARMLHISFNCLPSITCSAAGLLHFFPSPSVTGKLSSLPAKHRSGPPLTTAWHASICLHARCHPRWVACSPEDREAGAHKIQSTCPIVRAKQGRLYHILGGARTRVSECAQVCDQPAARLGGYPSPLALRRRIPLLVHPDKPLRTDR